MFFQLFNHFYPVRMFIFFLFFSSFTVTDVESSAIRPLARPSVCLHSSLSVMISLRWWAQTAGTVRRVSCSQTLDGSVDVSRCESQMDPGDQRGPA